MIDRLAVAGGVSKVPAGSCTNASEPRGLGPVDRSPAEAFDSYCATRRLSARTSCSRLEVALLEAGSINYERLGYMGGSVLRTLVLNFAESQIPVCTPARAFDSENRPLYPHALFPSDRTAAGNVGVSG